MRSAFAYAGGLDRTGPRGSYPVLGRFFGFLMAALVVVSLGGAIFLAYWDIPAPTSTVEKVLPNERFPE